MQIGELAKLADTPVETIRYYEKIGLLPPPARTSGNYRRYSSREIERLRFIRRCRRFDLALAEIGQLLAFCDEPDRRCDDVNKVLDEHIGELERRLHDLQSLSRELRQIRAVCKAPGKAANCRILRSLRS
jgi:Cd(II)/Pb(II)-responsive transcriptional regulator